MPAKARARSSYEPPRAKTERSSTLPSSGPSAPVSDCEPFSSWSKAASTGMYGELVAGGGDGRQRGRAGVHGQQVVHARAGQQLAVAAQVRGRLDGVDHQVPAGDLARGEARLLLQEGDQVALADVVAEAPDRLHVPLLVELEAVGVHRAVEVDGELGHAQQRRGRRSPGASLPSRRVSRPGQAEVAVEPGVEQRCRRRSRRRSGASRARPVSGSGLTRRFGESVCAPTIRKGVCGGGALGDVPGDDRAAAQHVPAAASSVPGVRLRDLPEAGLLQPLGGVRHGVVRRRTAPPGRT